MTNRNYTAIYEGYFNNTQADSDELVTDIEQSSINKEDEFTPRNYDYMIVASMCGNSDYIVETHPEYIDETKKMVSYYLNNYDFISKSSDVVCITRYEELASDKIIYDNKHAGMAICFKFAFSCSTTNIFNIYRLFSSLSVAFNKHFSLYDYRIYTEAWEISQASYFTTDKTLVDTMKHKVLYNKKNEHTTFQNLVWLGLIFRKDLQTYKRLVNKFGPEAQKNYTLSDAEYLAKSYADYNETKLYKVKLPASFLKKLNSCTIDTQALQNETTSFHIMMYDVERSDSMNTVHSDECENYIISELNSNPRTIQDIAIKQLDNYTRIIVFIYLGPFYYEPDNIIIESSIILNEKCYDSDHIEMLAEDFNTLCSNQISYDELLNTFTKYLHPSESL